MSSADRLIRNARRLGTRDSAWMWLSGLAVVWGVVIVVVALTVHGLETATRSACFTLPDFLW